MYRFGLVAADGVGSWGGNMATTQDVLDHHLEALRAGDVEAIMADYDDESVLATPGTTVRGLAALREFFTAAVTELLPPGSDLELTTQVVDGAHAYIVWRAESEKYVISFGTDTFVVRDDKIVFQSFAGQIEPK
jgi:hypothetical protein